VRDEQSQLLRLGAGLFGLESTAKRLLRFFRARGAYYAYNTP
jgi:hypothetical protein